MHWVEGTWRRNVLASYDVNSNLCSSPLLRVPHTCLKYQLYQSVSTCIASICRRLEAS